MTPTDREDMVLQSHEGHAVGRVHSVLWSDKSGTQIVDIEVKGSYLVVPCSPATFGAEIRTAFPEDIILSAPSLEQVADVVIKQGTDAAARILGEHFHVAVSGPPPGPPSTPVPPWIKRVLDEARPAEQADNEA